MSAKHTDIFNQLSATFLPATVKKWESKITAWEANPKARNPYVELEGGKSFCCYFFILLLRLLQATTLQDVRLALAKEEVAQIALRNLLRHKLSLLAFLIAGFKLEDTQYIVDYKIVIVFLTDYGFY